MRRRTTRSKREWDRIVITDGNTEIRMGNRAHCRKKRKRDIKMSPDLTEMCTNYAQI